MIQAIILITITSIFIIWVVIAISNFKIWAEKRDVFYKEEISGLKSLIKMELINLITQLKK